MVTIHPTRERRKYFLVSSDQENRTAARREIASWAAEHDLHLPARPRRLALMDEKRVVGEWVVIESPAEMDTTPEPPGLGLPKGFRLITGARAA